eukprot:TRINITY_DN7249_c0_g1_i1.p1 TRINITY_DN7249_c0_g1~~TRINITY_DN7249_c0_g1_i1.p1  ORF type:complete len:225 (-),score=45.04 TRINITY_DN7249_c0_g1_i1:18-692(-)
MIQGYLWTKAVKEVSFLKQFHHENIVKVYEIIDDPFSDYLYVVMDLLKEVVNVRIDIEFPHLTELRAKKYMKDIVNGLEYLHTSMNILHRDIKPNNLLVSKDDVMKIIDFSESSEFLSDDTIRDSAGTPSYFAPEQVVPYDSSCNLSGKAIDIYALGVTLFCFVTGMHPLSSHQIINIYDMEYTKISIPFNLSADLRDLLDNMLQIDPIKRYTLSEIKAHPWLV